jgi:3,4-dihydroxy 2-butanone 4-phosphate synthase / GTP cyclohydrolase II
VESLLFSTNFAALNVNMLHTIESAIEDIRNGKMVIVVDDEDRENEGDFIIAARHTTPEVINFMSKEGRGLICVALTDERCRELKLEPMVSSNTSLHETAFTISVDLTGPGTGTGISAQDRAKTIQALINKETKPEALARPGHISSPCKAGWCIAPKRTYGSYN